MVGRVDEKEDVTLHCVTVGSRITVDLLICLLNVLQKREMKDGFVCHMAWLVSRPIRCGRRCCIQAFI